MPKLIDPSFDGTQKPFDTEWFDTKQSPESAPLHETVANKVAVMGAVMDNSDIRAQYENIHHDLVSQGRSEDIERLKSVAQVDMTEDDVQAADIILRDPTATKEAKLAGLFEIQDRINTRDKVRLEDAFVSDQLIHASTNDKVEDRVHEGFFRNEEAIQQSNSEIESLIRRKVFTLDPSNGKAYTDFVTTAVLPGFGIKIKQIVDEVLPEQGPKLWNVLPGEAVVEFKKMLNAASPEQRVELAKRVLNAMDDTFTSSIHDNDFEKYDFINTLLGDLNPSDAAIDSDRWANNLFGVLDLIPILGTTTKGIIKIGKRISRSSPLAAMATAAPNNAKEYALGALQDDKLATAMGTTREEIAGSGVFPKDPTTPLESFPDLNAKLNELGVHLDGIDSHGINYTPAEKQTAIERASANVDALSKTDGVHLLNLSDIESIPGGYRTQFTVGHSDAYGFPTLQEARDAVGGYLEVQNGARVTFLSKDFKTGEYHPVAAPIDETPELGEYLARIDVKHIYNPSDVAGESLSGAVVGVSGGAAKYLDKSSVFTGWIVNAGNVAADKAALVRHQLEKQLTPLLKLNTEGQGKVFSVLDEGDQAGKWFDEAELIDRFDGRTDLIRAYKGVQRHQEALYELQNHVLHSKLTSAGFKQISNDQGFTNVAKPVSISDIEPGTTRVFDPDQGVMIDVSTDNLENLYNSGGFVARLPSYERTANEIYDLVFVRPNGRTRLTDLPAYVLNKRGGYITRVYDTNYVVKELRRGTHKNGTLVQPEPIIFNGRKLEHGDVLRSVKMASNRGEAERLARQLNANAEEGAEYGVVEAREIQDLNYAHQQDYNFYRDRGQLYFSKRGDEVEHVTGARTLSGIGEALEKARNSVARHVAMDDFIQSMTKRWEKQYGENFGVKGRMPLIGHIPRPADPGSLKDWKEAIALRDHIAVVAGADTAWSRQLWNRLVVNIADKVAGSGDSSVREALSAATLSKRTNDPISFLKKVAFTRFIALNPARQLLLQAQQASIYLGLDHGFKYFASGAGIKDFTGLTIGMVIKDRPEMWRNLAPKVAKGMGMTTAEFRKLVDSFNQTGLHAAIDSHPFANAVALGRQATVADSKLVQGWRNARETARSVTRYARMVGFDAGEYTNIATAWLAVRNRWIKNNPGKAWDTPEVLELLGGEARAVGFNMNASGALAFQKGTLGLLTQFMSHATKSAQVLIPSSAPVIGKLSNKAFSGRERGRIALTQLLLYGTGGFGLHKAFDAMRDSLGVTVPEQVNIAVREGINGSLINAAIQAADIDGEESDVEFSTSFGPMSGTPNQTPIGTLIKGMVDGLLISPMNSDTWRSMGPGLSIASDLKNVWDITHALTGVEDPDVSTSDKAVVAAREMAELLPVYSNYVRAKAAQKIGQLTSRSGNPTVYATGGEIMAKMWFGLRPHKEVAIGDLLRELHGNTRSVGEEGIDTELRDAANTLYKNTLRIARSLSSGEVDAATMLRISRKERESLKLALGDVQFWRLMRFFQNRVFSDLNENNESKLTRTLQNYYSKGALDPKSRVTTTIRNLPQFQGKDEILKWIDYTL